MDQAISCVSSTTESNSIYGYEDYPSYLQHVWPAIEANLDKITRIYAFCNQFHSRIRSFFREYHEISPAFLDLGSVSLISPERLENIKYLSYYGGDMNIFYHINCDQFLIDLISMWPHSSAVNRGLDTMSLSDNDKENVLHFASRACADGSMLLTFVHDADTMFVIGLYSTLDCILEQRGR